MHAVESSAKDRDVNLTGALQDLDTLMHQARDMVKLAKELNERLAASSSSPSSSSSVTTNTEPEEAAFIRGSLSQLGLQMPSAIATKDEDKWVNELAQELASILQGMMKERGIVALDEVWGGLEPRKRCW
jgi:ESCRT-II complex subunit VPS36